MNSLANHAENYNLKIPLPREDPYDSQISDYADETDDCDESAEKDHEGRRGRLDQVTVSEPMDVDEWMGSHREHRWWNAAGPVRS